MKNKRNDWFDKIYEEFLEHYRYLKESEVVSWYPSGPNTIVVRYENGSVFEYNAGTGHCRTIKYPGIIDDPEEELDEETCKEQFAFQLKEQLRNARMTQGDLARALDCSQGLISQYMTGRSMPNVWMLKRIAKVLGCSVDSLLWFNSSI